MSKTGYHHGDLANALLAAALKVVERGRAEALSMRELAASLGVSRAAPYRHFVDRDALLAAVAARGFDELNLGYEAALAVPGDGRARLRAANQIYFDFAVQRPGLHRLMFQSDLLERTPPPAVLIPPANKAYHLLWRAVEGAYPDADERFIKARTIIMWSTVFGFLALKGANRFKSFMVEPLSEDEVVEAVLDAAAGVDED